MSKAPCYTHPPRAPPLCQAADSEFKSEYAKAEQQWKADDEYELGISLNPIESRRAVFLSQQEVGAMGCCRCRHHRTAPLMQRTCAHL